MHFLIIPDSFKDSLTAQEVIEALCSGFQEMDSDFRSQSIIASDGGEGFLSFIQSFVAVDCIETHTKDPLGRDIVADYALSLRSPEGRESHKLDFAKASQIAYIELAKASGLELLSQSERNPLHTSTYGTGLQIKDAIDRGAQKIYIGLGGSATNDGGIGMAAALGFKFLDEKGHELSPIGKNLDLICQIQKPQDLVLPEIYAINDVDNVLTGVKGAAQVYGKQKGASLDAIESLDAGLDNLANIVQRELGVNNKYVPGTGAAGGSGYGLSVFFNAKFVAGVTFLTTISGVEETLIKGEFDAIITGEGSIDHQTQSGKLVKGISSLGKHYKIPVYAVCGINQLDSNDALAMGIKKTWAVLDCAKNKDDSYRNAATYLKKIAGKIYLYHRNNKLS